jgi:hypothetical protein
MQQYWTKYLSFYPDFDPHRRTYVWVARPLAGGCPVGIVKWFGRWRKYAFFPNTDCVFEGTCLRDISDFIEARTKEQRQRAAAQRRAA